MNNSQQNARVGLFFLLGVALVWVTFETLSDGKIFAERTHTLIAGFDDLKELKNGDDVRQAGVKVGSVQMTRPKLPSGARAPCRQGTPACAAYACTSLRLWALSRQSTSRSDLPKIASALSAVSRWGTTFSLVP